MLFTIVLYASTNFFASALTDFAKGILSLASVYLLIKNPENIRREPLVIILILMITSSVATWISVYYLAPEYSPGGPKIDRLTKLFLFIPIAWWLAGREQRITQLLLITFVGFLIGCAMNGGGFTELLRAFDGRRVDFGIRNAQHTGMVFGLMVLASFIIGLFPSKGSSRFVLRVTLSSIFFTLGIIGVIVTQSRQVWLALITAFILSSFALVLVQKKRNLRQIIFSLLTITLVSCTLVFSDVGQSRFHEATQTLEIAENGKIPDSSTGIRLQTWLEAAKWIKEKPLLGWDSDARHLVISESTTLSKMIRTHYGHLHNFHIETLLSYGLIGLLLMWSIYGRILYCTYKIKDCTRHGSYWFIFSVAFVTYWMVINNFESFNSFWTGVFMQNIIMACLFARYLTVTRKMKECESPL
ncbi:O-antigen ligase family protein [Photobacterium sp. CCB-ST2H9]|uniref:O-antigen ligase family protein n=1 Tax=Photobacterium sp. CCB-ST2H9 TaxID=2912855 RepID=UPI0020068D16|nr:O-antigen ligase family protein [Photobacterium sp. CCB-ST2H9]UTM57504.1 O-antigen ligase family protein [Photobacterium sp. CCB-ST2H9]